MKKKPVYKLEDFGAHREVPFYVNRLPLHLKEHRFVNSPHRHDFYLVVFFTAGKGIHEIDFNKYKVERNTLFFMQPGQMHNWTLSADTDGYVFFHSRTFYEEAFHGPRLREFSFFRSIQENPILRVKTKDAIEIKSHFEDLLNERSGSLPFKAEKVRLYMNSIYLDIARLYPSEFTSRKGPYLDHLNEFQKLIESHFHETRSPADYAHQLGISEKHLNRISRESLNKTSTDVISDRVILEARRMLLEKDRTVSAVAYDLNFSDLSYFSRFFKKHTGTSPQQFVSRFTNQSP